MTSTDEYWRKLTNIVVNWRQMTSIDEYWRQLSSTDGYWPQLTDIDVSWRQLTQIKIDASVNFRRFSSIFVNKIFQNFKILKNVKKRQKLSKNVRDVIKHQNSSLLTRQVIWRQLTSMKTTKWRLTSCWRSSIDVKKCQLTSIVAWRYHYYKWV